MTAACPAPAPALLVYPTLWQRSLAEHPTDWRNQFRCLCELAEAFTTGSGDQRVPLAALPKGEKMLLRSLATIDVEMYLFDLVAAFPLEDNPLTRLDPGPDCGLTAVGM